MAMMTRNDLMRLVCLTIGVENFKQNVTLFYLIKKINGIQASKSISGLVYWTILNILLLTWKNSSIQHVLKKS